MLLAMRPFCCAFAAFILAAACLAQSPALPAYESNPEFLKLRAEARRQMLVPDQRMFAAKTWAKANAVAGGHCIECLEGMVHAHVLLRETKDAIKVASAMEAEAITPRERATAEIWLGRAVIDGVNHKKPNLSLLGTAHDSLVKAEAVFPAAYFLDGRVLSLMHRDAEASAAFAAYAGNARPGDLLLLRARHFADRPELAREDMVPAVAVTTAAGKQFNLDAMNGKVVLIDFWATWCGPCLRELPHLRSIAETYANAPFELISISWDSDEARWKKFIQDNRMTWNQFRDADHAVTNLFNIDAIPHYFTIDADGVLTAENLGSESNIDGRIRKLVEKARESARPQAVASGAKETPPGVQ